MHFVWKHRKNSAKLLWNDQKRKHMISLVNFVRFMFTEFPMSAIQHAFFWTFILNITHYVDGYIAFIYSQRLTTKWSSRFSYIRRLLSPEKLSFTEVFHTSCQLPHKRHDSIMWMYKHKNYKCELWCEARGEVSLQTTFRFCNLNIFTYTNTPPFQNGKKLWFMRL